MGIKLGWHSSSVKYILISCGLTLFLSGQVYGAEAMPKAAAKATPASANLDSLQAAVDAANRALADATAAAAVANEKSVGAASQLKAVRDQASAASAKAQDASNQATKQLSAKALAANDLKSKVLNANNLSAVADQAAANYKKSAGTKGVTQKTLDGMASLAKSAQSRASDAKKAAEVSAQAAKDSEAKYNDLKSSADAAAANAKAYAGKVAEVGKMADQALSQAMAAQSVVNQAKTKCALAQNALASAQALAAAAAGVSSASLSFAQEFNEVVPAVSGWKGVNGWVSIAISDKKYSAVSCIFAGKGAFKEYVAAQNYQDAKLDTNVNKWVFYMSPNGPKAGRYDIQCRAQDGTKAGQLTSVREILFQPSLLDGRDPQKERCDYQVSGKSDAFFVAKARAGALSDSGAFVKSDLSAMPYVLTFNRGMGFGKYVPGKGSSISFQLFSSMKKINFDSTGHFVVLRREWRNGQIGCNLPAVKKAFWAAYPSDKNQPWRWLNTGVTGSTELVKPNALQVGNMNYNSNAASGVALVMNANGSAVLLDANGAVVKKFSSVYSYLRHSMRKQLQGALDDPNADLYFQN